ncbi:MAG TPA: dockerin type I domain-containing protein, partial [Tepidisphaeraceae bacterium]|nr:dockerin type I domain-containing protein [Tepidisphaeraceae bacterium]
FLRALGRIKRAAAEANAVRSTFPATFLGQSIDATSVLLRFGPRGDANLDGLSNADDLARLSASYRQGGRTFADGNFDYSADGTVGLADLAELASAYQPGPAALLEPDRPVSSNGPSPTIPIALPGAPAGLDLSKFTIRRNLESPVSLAGSGVTLDSSSAGVVALGNLPSVMSQRGFYTITLDPTGWTAGGMTLGGPLVFTYHNYLVGDMNSDGQVNNLDIAPFVSGLTSPQSFASVYGYSPLLTGDVNGDGQFNNLDIAPFVALLTGARPSPTGMVSAVRRPAVRPAAPLRPVGLFT